MGSSKVLIAVLLALLLGALTLPANLNSSANVVTLQPSAVAAQALTNKSVAGFSVQAVKASPGNLYGFSAANANASVCWIQFQNAASAPALGTAVITAFAIPASATLTISPGEFALANFAAGISGGGATTPTGSTACTTTLNVTVLYQ